MKIAFFHPFLNVRGGAERKLLLICEGFIDQGDDVELFVAKLDRSHTFHELIPKQLKIREIRCFNLLFWIFRIFCKLIGSKYDLLIASNFPANIPLIFYKIVARKAKIIWICNEIILSSWLRKFFFLFEKKWIDRFDQIIVNSQFTASKMRILYHLDPIVIYSGIQLSSIFDLTGIRSIITSLKSGSYLLILSRAEEHKNLRFIPCICQLFPDQSVVFAGTGRDAALLRNFASQYANFTYLGEVNPDEKCFLYQNCILYAFLPHEEPLGVVVMEAIAANKPVIAFASGGPLEIILHKQNGFLCKSEEEYIDAIRYVIGEKFRVIPELGYGYISQRFSSDNMKNEFCSLLKSFR
jgi:glycosyltransferase involved in cell wall biosynthesis